MDEALVSWFILAVLFLLGLMNRFWHALSRLTDRCPSTCNAKAVLCVSGLQRRIHSHPNTCYFILLILATIFAYIQADPERQKAGDTTKNFMFVSLVVCLLAWIESCCNKRTYLAVVGQYQFLTLLTFSLLMLKTLMDIWNHEYRSYGNHWIPTADVKEALKGNLNNLRYNHSASGPDSYRWILPTNETLRMNLRHLNKTQINKELAELNLDDSVRIISRIGVLAAFGTVCVVVYHIYELVKQMSLQDMRMYKVNGKAVPVTFNEMRMLKWEQNAVQKQRKRLAYHEIKERAVEEWLLLDIATEAPVAAGGSTGFAAVIAKYFSRIRPEDGPSRCNFLCHFLCGLQEPYAANIRSTKFDFNSLSELRHDLVLQIVLLPLIFAFLALRAHLRMIRIFNGSLEKVLRTGLSWGEAKDFNMHMFEADLDLASAAEIYTILCLLFFCLDIMGDKVQRLKTKLGEDDDKEVAEDLKRTLKNTSLQGVVSFVIVGTIKAFTSFLDTVILLYLATGRQQCEHDFQSFAFVCRLGNWEKIQGMLESFKTILQPVMVLTSLQCIWNMMSICGFGIQVKIRGTRYGPRPFQGMKELKERGFDKRLTGVRCLILIAQIQLGVLKFITKKEHLEWVAPNLTPWQLPQVMAVHSALICIECLGVALWQFLLWRWDEVNKILSHDPKMRFGGDLVRPLVPPGQRAGSEIPPSSEPVVAV